MQSTKSSALQSESIAELINIIRPESTAVKIEITNDEQDIAEDIISTETIIVKQEINEPQYDVTCTIKSEVEFFETKLEFEEATVNVLETATTSKKRNLQNGTDSNEKRYRFTVPEKCQTCGQAFGSYSDYKQHSHFHEDKRSRRCHHEGCNQIFRTPNLLLRHLATRHATIYKGFECGICDQKFQLAEDCERHRKTLHPKPFSCFACGQYFAFKKDLLEHRTVEHSAWEVDWGEDDDDDESETDDSEQDTSTDSEECSESDTRDSFEKLNEGQYGCALCRCSFKSSHDLNIHVRSHTEANAFKCLIEGCEKIYSDATDRNKHTRRHLHLLERSDVTKSNVCKFCNKAFEDSVTLQRHISVHVAQEPSFHWYSCELCEEQFTTAQQHRLHMNRHKGQKPFKCSECGEGFTSRYNRNRHEQKDACVGVEMVLCCVDCDEEFDSALKLSKHKEMNLCPVRNRIRVEST
ncbi:AAEL014210-PA [Aedes aegypti]|uniref:AAEL014210-PA n=1 Tax=Aedes aegypti TaxID=7159 RepID=Q16GZ6_AEDAE|nr:AAEL014210-PA [Aedes aegypti]